MTWTTERDSHSANPNFVAPPVEGDRRAVKDSREKPQQPVRPGGVRNCDANLHNLRTSRFEALSPTEDVRPAEYCSNPLC